MLTVFIAKSRALRNILIKTLLIYEKLCRTVAKRIKHDSQQAYIDVKRIQIPWRTDPFGDKQIRYVSGGTCLKCLSLLGKFSASLGKGWVGSTWWPMTWRCVPQVTDSAQWGVANHRLPNWLLGWIKKLDA